MPLELTQDLMTGSKPIDDQHQELIDRINQLFDACSQHKGKEEIRDVLRYLEDYCVVHFRTEEEWMHRHNYDGYSSHRAEHKEFVDIFSKLKEAFEKEGNSSAFVIRVNRTLIDHLTEHVLRTDKKLAEFLQGKEV